MKTGAILLLVLSAFIWPRALAAQTTIDLYTPARGPGSEQWTFQRTTRARGNETSIYNVRDPRIEVHLPDPAFANGTAVIILPGGGLRVLGRGKDTQDLIELLLARGIAAIHLEYRTLQVAPETLDLPSPASTAPPAGQLPAPSFPKLEIVKANANPAKGNTALDEVLRLAIEDAQQALRLVRSRAAEWRIDPRRIGMLGTSAGGGVAIGALLADDPAARPDFLVSIYGPSLQDVDVRPDAPPLFIATEADHGPVTDGLLALFELWNEARRPAELHVYSVPTFATPVSLWGHRLLDWMEEQELVPRPSE